MQNKTDVLLGFLLILLLYFSLYYHLFFRKEFFFFECLCFSEYDIRMLLQTCKLRDRTLSM